MFGYTHFFCFTSVVSCVFEREGKNSRTFKPDFYTTWQFYAFYRCMLLANVLLPILAAIVASIIIVVEVCLLYPCFCEQARALQSTVFHTIYSAVKQLYGTWTAMVQIKESTKRNERADISIVLKNSKDAHTKCSFGRCLVCESKRARTSFFSLCPTVFDRYNFVHTDCISHCVWGYF